MADIGIRLAWRPEQGPFRWLPKQGEPTCVGEWVAQWCVRFCADIRVYTAIVTTLTFVVVLVTR